MAEKDNQRAGQPETTGALEDLTPRLLPLLTERMGRLSRCIEILRKDNELRAGEPYADLDGICVQIDQLGWALGITCAHGGADVLMERVRPDGLTVLLNLVRELRGKEPLKAPLPKLTSNCPSTFAFGIAQLIWWGSAAAQTPIFQQVDGKRGAWSIQGIWQQPIELAPLVDLGPGSDMSLTDKGHWHLEVPGDWMHP
jgi:hypothetical protein